MRHEKFIYAKYGFAGDLYVPDMKSEKAVIVISGGEQDLMPSREVAEIFAQNGFTALSVALFSKSGMPSKSPSAVPLEMIEKTVKILKKHGYKIAVYGMSMGSIFAAYAALYIEGITDIIMVSPAHAAFEGTTAKKCRTGRSLITWRGKDLPFVCTDFAQKKMFDAFEEAYSNKEKEKAAAIPIEKIKSRILMLASEKDEIWNAAYSVRFMEKRLRENNFAYPFKAVIYKGSGHLIGIISLKEKHPFLYALMPIIYKAERNRCICEKVREKSKKEIIDWLKNKS